MASVQKVTTIAVSATGVVVDNNKQAQTSSLAREAKTQIGKRKPSKDFGSSESKSFWKDQKGCKKSSEELVRIRRVIFGIRPFVKTTNLNRDAQSATSGCSDTLRLIGSPAKNERKVVAKDRLPIPGVQTTGLRVPRYRISEEVYCTDKCQNSDQLAPSHSPRARGTTSKLGRKRVHRKAKT